MSISNDLYKKVFELRCSNISVEDFHKWANNSSETLSKITSKGGLLKLKYGDFMKITEAYRGIFPACEKCSFVFKEGEFLNRQDHLNCTNSLSVAISSGFLFQVVRPAWFKSDNYQLGADAYYECASCGAVWSLVEPERQYNGLWERII